jgi:hypothetical protein
MASPCAESLESLCGANFWFVAERNEMILSDSSLEVVIMSLHQTFPHFFVSAVLLLFSGSILHSEEPPAATLSLQDIRKAAMDRAASIHNVRVEYDCSWKKLLDVPSLTSMHGVLTPYHVVFAFDGERRYMDLKPTGSFPKGSPRWLHKVKIFDGQFTYSMDKDFLAMVGVAKGKERTCEDSEIYCHNVLQIPYRDQDRVNLDDSFFYPHCIQEIRRHPPYRVLPAQELVDGHWCHVLEYPRLDKIWVDPKLGCAIRKRERYTEAKGNPFLFQSNHSSQFIESAPGIQVPAKFTCAYFAGPGDPPEFLGRQYLELTITVKNIAVNQVTDADFYLPVQPGTIVVDEKGSYRIQGNKTILLNELADAAKVRLDGETPWHRRVWVLILIIPLVLILVGSMIQRGWRAWRARSASTQPPPSQTS